MIPLQKSTAEAALNNYGNRAIENLGNDELQTLYKDTRSLQRHDVQQMPLSDHLNNYKWLKKVIN